MGILTNTEHRIIKLYTENILLSASIRGIMKLLKSNSYNRIHDAVNNLVDKSVLEKEKIGNTNIVRLKNSREATLWLGFLDDISVEIKPLYNRIISIEEISDYLVLITGSYAKRTQNKTSDTDLVIVVPDHEDIVSIQKLIENKTIMWRPKMHIHILRKNDFSEMLYEKENNFGKELVKHKIILKNARIYYETVLGAISYGYKG